MTRRDLVSSTPGTPGSWNNLWNETASTAVPSTPTFGAGRTSDNPLLDLADGGEPIAGIDVLWH